jgi:hypothetical protein
VNSKLGEHLSVYLDALAVKTVDEFAIANTTLLATSVDSGDPKLTEIALLLASVTKGVLPRLHDLLMSTLKYVLLSSKIAGSGFYRFLVALVAHKATFNSCHCFSSFASAVILPGLCTSSQTEGLITVGSGRGVEGECSLYMPSMRFTRLYSPLKSSGSPSSRLF